MTSVKRAVAAGLSLLALAAAAAPAAPAEPSPLDVARIAAERQLQQTFTNLQFENFGPSPVKGPVYQATAGGRIVYFAPDSGHLLFAAVYDKNGVNLTALAQDADAAKKLSAIDPAKALAMGPATAPTVIEFTDPDCTYCQALDRFWAVKATEGKPVRRLVYFVSGIHMQAAAKAEHILCSPDPVTEFEALYKGSTPLRLRTCAAGAAKVAAMPNSSADRGQRHADVDRRWQARLRFPAGRTRGVPRQTQRGPRCGPLSTDAIAIRALAHLFKAAVRRPIRGCRGPVSLADSNAGSTPLFEPSSVLPGQQRPISTLADL